MHNDTYVAKYFLGGLFSKIQGSMGGGATSGSSASANAGNGASGEAVGGDPQGGGVMAALSTATGALGSIPRANGGEQAASIKAGIRSVTDKLGPIGAIVGMADDALGGIAQAFGKSLAGASTGDKVISSIPVIGNMASFFGSKLTQHNFDKSSVASDFSFNKEAKASDLGGKQMLFGKGKKEKQIAEAWRLYNKKADITDYNKKRLNNSIGTDLVNLNDLMYSGQDMSYSLAGKHGMKFPELNSARKLISTWSSKSTEKQKPEKFQLGGKIEDKNIIPTGELHKNLHHLEDKHPELKDSITKKGIPVVTYSENGITQIAEIEKDEWTLRKEFTDKLESLYETYQKEPSDKIAIEAGKLICYELLKNTDDKSKLIKTIK